MIKHLYNRIFINRICKLLVCMTLQKRIVADSFKLARQKIQDKAVWNVQRVIRGHMAINKGENMKRVRDALAAKQNLRLHVSAKKVQKRLRGILVRKRIEYIN